MKDTLIPSFSGTLNADSHVEDSIPFQPETTLLFPIEQPERKEEKDDGKMTRKRKRSQSDSTQNQIRAVLTEFKVDNCEEQEGTQPEYDSIEKYIENEISPSLKPISSSHFLLSSENSNLPQPNPDLRTNSVSYPIHAQAPLTSPLSSRMRHNQRPLIQKLERNSNLSIIVYQISTNVSCTTDRYGNDRHERRCSEPRVKNVIIQVIYNPHVLLRCGHIMWPFCISITTFSAATCYGILSSY